MDNDVVGTTKRQVLEVARYVVDREGDRRFLRVD